MLQFFTDWLRQLILLVLLASFFEMILPNSSLQRYTRVVLGLFILLTLLSPIFTLFQISPNFDQLDLQRAVMGADKKGEREVASLIHEGENLYQQQQEELLSLLSQQLSEELANEILNHFDYVADVEFQFTWTNGNQPEINKILVYLQGQVHKQNSRTEAYTVSATVTPIKPIQIEIDPKGSSSQTNELVEETEAWTGEIQEFIQRVYSLTKEQVIIYVEKGRKSSG